MTTLAKLALAAPAKRSPLASSWNECCHSRLIQRSMSRHSIANLDTSETVDALQRLPWLEPHKRNQRRCFELCSGQEDNNAHDRAVRDCKAAPFRLYDLRHTWASRAAMSGVDLVTLAAMLGHSRIQMVLRYAHPTQQHQHAAWSGWRSS